MRAAQLDPRHAGRAQVLEVSLLHRATRVLAPQAQPVAVERRVGVAEQVKRVAARIDQRLELGISLAHVDLVEDRGDECLGVAEEDAVRITGEELLEPVADARDVQELVARPRPVRVAAADVMVGRAVLGDPERSVMLGERRGDRRLARGFGPQDAHADDAAAALPHRGRLREVHLHFNYCSGPVGDEQRLPYDQLIRASRESYDNGRDFTVAVEEEFAVLDPSTHDLVNRFEDLQAAARGTPLEEHLVGELIASEVEVRTGRCETWNEASARMAERRAQLVELADSLGIVLASTGTHPWANWKDQRIIDTPHYRRNDELLRYVVWRNNTFGLHVHVGIRGADRAVRVFSAFRNYLPELLALSASSPFVEDVNSGLHSARTEIFTRMFPRCGVPDTYGSWQEWEDYVRLLYETGSITEHTQIWWSVRPHLAFPTVEVRICDAQPTLEEGQALAAFIYALTCRIARALDDGEPLPDFPHRLIEENFWRAIRWGLAGEFIDLATRDVLPTRARLQQLADWTAPVADELGVPVIVPSANATERQLARLEEGATLREIYAEHVLESVRA